jgi:hypothetical protein
MLLHNGGFCNGSITNGFCSHKLSIHKKTNIMQTMAKILQFFIYLIFHHREIVKLDHFMTLSLSYANTVLRCSRCKIHPFVAAPLRYIYNRLEEFSQKRANVVSQGEGEYTIKAPYKMNKPLQVRAHIPSVVDLLRFDANPDPDPTTSFTILGNPNFSFFNSQ